MKKILFLMAACIMMIACASCEKNYHALTISLFETNVSSGEFSHTWLHPVILEEDIDELPTDEFINSLNMSYSSHPIDAPMAVLNVDYVVIPTKIWKQLKTASESGTISFKEIMHEVSTHPDEIKLYNIYRQDGLDDTSLLMKFTKYPLV